MLTLAIKFRCYSIHRVCLPLTITFIVRSMHIVKHLVKTHIIPKSHSALSPLTPKGPTRGMVAYTYNHPDQSITSKGTSPESNVTGAHELTFMAACHKKNCKDQNCATGTQLSTGTLRLNPCNEPPQYHQHLSFIINK